jgi:CDP-glucose 4,6-dehydratase
LGVDLVELSGNFWKGRRVLITGHTGFKGSWLALWLRHLGASINGFALSPATVPSLFELARVADSLESSVVGDVRDLVALCDATRRCSPEVVFHLAAQSLVRESYRHPNDTFAVNVMGTVHLLEAVRRTPGIQAVVVVTTDKVYANPGGNWCWPYREPDPLGASDPYSSSKACSELVAASYAASFLSQDSQHAGLATARSGNVLGGGDWSSERLVPDCIRAFQRGEQVVLRYSKAIRPWQHVLDALRGYILLAEKLASGDASFRGAWNFSPQADDALTVEQLVAVVCRLWGPGAAYSTDTSDSATFKEADFLTLDHSKAVSRLGWKPLWNTQQTLARTVSWYKRLTDGMVSAGELCREQIKEHEGAL